MTKKGRRLKDAKAERTEKKRRARRRKRIIVLIVELLIFIVLLGIAMWMKIYGKFQHAPRGEVHINEGVENDKYTTIALFGVDSREEELGEGTHADTIIVVSIDKKTKEVRLASIYRDTLVKGANGKLQKANQAYYNGGPEEARNMLNTNFDLDIKDYVAVDFKAVADVIDILGGVELEVTEAEANAINAYIGETAEAAKKDAILVSPGTQTLDGVQAVTYARIRKGVGDDFKRTERQRELIQVMLDKFKGMELSAIKKILDNMDTLFPKVRITIGPGDLFELVIDMTSAKIVGTSGYPYEIDDANINGLGSVILPAGHEKNVVQLHEFLYPKEEYVTSPTVQEIATEIDNVSVR